MVREGIPSPEIPSLSVRRNVPSSPNLLKTVMIFEAWRSVGWGRLSLVKPNRNVHSSPQQRTFTLTFRKVKLHSVKTLQTFAANVRRFRLARGITQGQLAELIGVTTHTVFHYESAARWPRDEGMDGLAKALGVRPWQLLAGEGEGGAVPPELIDHIAAAARACGLKIS